MATSKRHRVSGTVEWIFCGGDVVHLRAEFFTVDFVW